MMREEPLHTSKISVRSLNQKGSILLSALVVGVVIVIMILAAATYIRSRAQAIAGSSNKMDNRIALDGMLAYTINGIKQSWCFTNTWTQQPTCTLTDNRNSIRLTISDESLMYLASSLTPHPTPTSATRLSSISQTVSLGSINTLHPLYNIARPLNGKYTTVSFTIARDDSAIATTKGREVRLKIAVKLTASSGKANDDLELVSQIIVYPRELSYFGLILPQNLYLGSEVSTKADTGLKQVAVSNTAGLRFESPVFVNNNLYLPTSSPAMENVVFLDKVVIGGGMIYKGNTLFSPPNAGGDKNMYNHEINSFAGFLGGYELDADKDAGLEYLFKTAVDPAPLSMTQYELCIARIQASYDLTKTKNSQLFVKQALGGGLDVFNLAANIGNIDNLVEQKIESTDAYQIKTNVPGVTNAGTVDSFSSGAVFKAKVVFSGLMAPGATTRGVYYSEFYLARNGQVTLYPQGNTSAASPRMVIATSANTKDGNPQFNQVNMQVSFVNTGNLDLGYYNSNGIGLQDSVKILLEGYDYGYNQGYNIRSTNMADGAMHPVMGVYKTNGFTFNKSGGAMQLANTVGTEAWTTNEILSPINADYPKYESDLPMDTDFSILDAACMAQPSSNPDAYYASFPSANWGTSFAKQSEHAWKFTPDDDFNKGYFEGTKIFDAGNAKFDPSSSTYPTFRIYSVVKECVIASTANFVTGFYTCETLTIQARSKPLRIIGTFIVGTLKIDDTAYTSGIRWSSIYHPQALYELRAAHILGKYKDLTMAPCDDPNLPPLWSPNLGITSALIHYLCNPVSLRTADPFKWTMVDPDCGIDASVDALKVACKSQPRRFLIKEISRTKGM